MVTWGHLVLPWERKINPMTFVMLQYSQPIQIFRLPARINLNMMQNFAYRSNDGKSFGAVGISWDIVLAQICGWYFGIGAEPYMRDSGDNYDTSRLLFRERVFIGNNVKQSLSRQNYLHNIFQMAILQKQIADLTV